MATDRRISPASSFTFVNLSDTEETTLIDLGAMYNEEASAGYPRGFHSNVNGTVMVELVGGISGASFPIKVNAGSIYPYSIKKFLLTGSLTINDHDLIAFR
jgi:hypothetical protein